MKKLKNEDIRETIKNNFLKSLFILLIKFLSDLLTLSLIAISIYSIVKYKFSEITVFDFISPMVNSPVFSTGVWPIYIFIPLAAFSFLAFMPLKSGIYLWFSKIKKDNKTSCLIIFHYYKNLTFIIKSISLNLIIFLKSLINFSVIFIPTVMTFLLACLKLNDCPYDYQTILRIIIIISALMIIIGIFLFFKMQLLQILTNFIFVLNNKLSAFSCIKSSIFLMRSNNNLISQFKIYFYYYIFSIIFIIPLLFLMPYFYTILYEFTKKIIYKQNQGLSSIPLTEKVIDISPKLYTT